MFSFEQLIEKQVSSRQGAKASNLGEFNAIIKSQDAVKHHCASTRCEPLPIGIWRIMSPFKVQLLQEWRLSEFIVKCSFVPTILTFVAVWQYVSTVQVLLLSGHACTPLHCPQCLPITDDS